MAEIDNPYGVDAEMGRGKTLLNLIAEGFDGQQIGERHDVSPERAEELILLYARRVLRGDAPPAPAAECRVSEFDGWCFKHGCHHPVPDNATVPAACVDEWQPPHDAGSYPEDCRTCGEGDEEISCALTTHHRAHRWVQLPGRWRTCQGIRATAPNPGDPR